MIQWHPVGQTDETPHSVNYYEIYQDGTKLGETPEQADFGMPDSLGGVAPDAVRQYVQDRTDKTAYEADQRTEYSRGKP